MDVHGLYLLARDLDALSHASRLGLLQALAVTGEAPVALLAGQVVGLKNNCAGVHLRRLHASGLVGTRPLRLPGRGQVHHYRLCLPRLETTAEGLALFARRLRAEAEAPRLPFREVA